eukprot:TRINITY_DN7878_c0_g1_i1.p1 TRINITY_DN7878_c0_g1~~TRINITY_DN7878_c0_g1_i1.p1  ORF type:complete len:442 (+),score=135.03 TRINITY_DN7878_c0_g1_i1:65-1327(+)
MAAGAAAAAGAGRRDIDPLSKQPFNTLAQYERRALELLEEPVRSYWQWYLDEKESYARGREAYAGVLLRTRCLAGAGPPELLTTVYGQTVRPVGVSPSAFHNFGHPDGEIATARGVAAAGGIYCYNYYFGSKALEDVTAAWQEASAAAEGAGGSTRLGAIWLHLYIHSNRESLSKALRRAEAAEVFSAIVVTADHPHNRVYLGTKPVFVALGRSVDQANTEDDFDVTTASWDDLRWLCAATTLPVIAKGVMCEEDARLAVAAGCRGIFVSAHGGRQCAHCPSALEQLPGIVRAVGAAVGGNVFVDTGVRCGGHVVKAAALGARAVFVGRPALYGLLCGGAAGVSNVLGILASQARDDAACTGVRSWAELGPHCVARIDGPVAQAMQGSQRSGAANGCALVAAGALLGAAAAALLRRWGAG